MRRAGPGPRLVPPQNHPGQSRNFRSNLHTERAPLAGTRYQRAVPAPRRAPSRASRATGTGHHSRSRRRAPRSQQLVAQLPSGARGHLLQATPFRLSPFPPASSPNRSAERQRRFSCAVSAQSTRKTTRASPEGLAVAMSDRLLLRCRLLAATLSARTLARGTGE